MSIDKKLNYVAHWSKAQAQECWSRYEKLYFEKHGGAMHYAIINGNLDKYIDRECRVFQRYAQMWAHVRGLTERKPLTWSQKDVMQHQLGRPLPDEIQNDMHHIAQENKLKRLKRGDYFP